MLTVFLSHRCCFHRFRLQPVCRVSTILLTEDTCPLMPSLHRFYRSSAREMKRLDSLLRSLLYAHLAESLTGLATIRSYREIGRFIRDDQYYIDL
jgi:hypothetical protein